MGPGQRVYWLCQCDCGSQPRPVRAYNLKRGKSTNCGCETYPRKPTKQPIHGKSYSRTYRIWTGMLARCRQPKHSSYQWYGAIGISVCERWLKFENFLEDMGEAPDGLSIERRDNKIGYCPENCHWADNAAQHRNYAQNVNVTIGGIVRCLADWADIAGVGRDVVYGRRRTGWPLERWFEPKTLEDLAVTNFDTIERTDENH